MRRVGLIVLGLLIGLLQISLRGWGADVVIPNIALVMIVFLSARMELSNLGTVALACGVMLELSSAAPLGTQIFGIVLLVLVSKLLLRSTEEDSQFLYLYGLLLSSTIGYSLAIAFTVPFSEIQSHWWLLTSHIILECLYNSILFGFCMAVGARRIDTKKAYRLPM